ncbi:sugar translocase [Pseudoscardovia radai]|uniref:Sugar translocase n=1 Tax=Pseudoscardovia radai TaxID=987066 RepID=A0A261EZU3_9BIFI|nr:sugar translocase [Pseudoscardovia radai]
MARVKKLIEQVLKFGIVGIIAFIIDWGILNLLVIGVHMNATLAATISFLISLCFNYLASMKFVFVHRDDMARWMEVLIFFVSSAIGLGINDAIIWFSTSVIINPDTQFTDHGRYALYANIGKLVATVIVSVWNFVIRKWLLDAPDPGKPVNEKSVAHRIGTWSLSHGPGAKARLAASDAADAAASDTENADSAKN